MSSGGRDRGTSLAEIEAVYRQRLPAFRRVAAAIVGDADAGRDAVQDAFASAVRRRASFRGDSPLEAWLWRAVVNTARNHRRSRPLVAEPRELQNGHLLEDSVDARLAVALALLPERQRYAIFLRYYADLDYRSIAQALGVSGGTVAATLSAARATLRRQLEEVPHE